MRNVSFKQRITVLAAAAAVGATGLIPVAAVEAAIEDIVVTARKREENLQEIPVAVSAFGEQAIEARQIRTVDDFARFTPGLSFSNTFGRSTERPVIRGLGNVLAGVQFGVESGAAYFVDGLYYPGDIQTLNIQNVERVEVIKGPQSALYGRNTYSGAINYVTKGPNPDRFSGDFRASAGSDDEIDASATLSGPLVPGVLAGGLTLRKYSFDGEYLNTVTGETVGDQDTDSVSAVLDWTPGADWSVRGRLSYQDNDDGTRPFFLQPSEANNCFPGTRSNAAWTAVSGSNNANQYYCGEIERPSDTVALNDGPAIQGQPAPIRGVPDQVLPGNFVFGTPGGQAYNPAQGVAFSGVEREITYASLLADWDIRGSGWIVNGGFAYRDEELKTGSDSDHSAVNFLPGDDTTGECTFCASEIDEAEDYSVELRIESPADRRLRGMFGVYYYDQDKEGRDITYENLDGGPVEDDESTTNEAVFGMLEYDFTDRLSAALELRWFEEEKTLTELDPDSGAILFAGDVSFDEVAPRFTVDWRLTDTVLLYGIYAKGYKPGGLNGTAGESVSSPGNDRTGYGQEEADSYELGLKSSWFEDRLTANLAAFFIDTKDIQLTTPLPSGAGQLTSIVTNQGSGETTGLELELNWIVNDYLSVGANYALADTEFTEGCDEFQWTLTSGGGTLSDFASCTGNNPNGQGDGSIEGNQFPLASEHQFSAYADFRSQIGGGDLEFFTNVDVSWEDEKAVQVHNLAWVPDSTILNGRIGIGNERWTLALYGRNLTDEDAPAMATRWLQDPLIITAAGFPDTTGLAPPGACAAPGSCSTSLPRAFFADLRRGRNYGVEFRFRFGAL